MATMQVPAPDGMAIRPARPSEHELLSTLALRSKASWGYPPELLATWADDLTVSSEYISGADVFCAEESGRVVGFAALRRCDGELELEHLWVEPDRFGRGIGGTLMMHSLERAGALGAERVRVVADPNAEAFYLRFGAVRVGEHESVPPGRMLPVLMLPVLRDAGA